MIAATSDESGSRRPGQAGWWTRPELADDLARAAAMVADPEATRIGSRVSA